MCIPPLGLQRIFGREVFGNLQILERSRELSIEHSIFAVGHDMYQLHAENFRGKASIGLVYVTYTNRLPEISRVFRFFKWV